MSPNLVPVLQTIATVLAVFAMIWRFRKDILTEVDKKFETFTTNVNNRFDAIDNHFDAIDRRFDKIEATLETVQQNHLDHITQLHVGTPVATTTAPIPNPIVPGRRSRTQETE